MKPKITVDEILTNLGAYKITSFDPTTEEYYAYYPELKRAKAQLDQLIRSCLVEKKELDEASVRDQYYLGRHDGYNRCLKVITDNLISAGILKK